MKIIDVILAENHALVRDGIKMLLETDDTIRIIGVAKNSAEIMSLLSESAQVDILITDVDMLEMDGLSLLTRLKSISPSTATIILSMHRDITHLRKAFDQGAVGYVLKESDLDELVFAIKTVAKGKSYLCTELSLQLLEISQSKADKTATSLPLDYSKRELEILQLISEGKTNQEISEKLFLSKRTVEGYRQGLLNKTESKNTASLIKYAVIRGLVR